MGSVTTTTLAGALSPPNTPAIARSADGRQYAIVLTATDTLTLFRSLDNGGTWTQLGAAFTHTGLQEWSRPVVDPQPGDYLHLAYRVGTGTADTIWYRRFFISGGAWTPGLQTSATDANSGTIGQRWQGVDLIAYRNSDNTYAIVVAGAFYDPGNGRFGACAMGVFIDTAKNITANNTLIENYRFWYQTGTPPGRSGITAEVEHNGNGQTVKTPNIWLSWGRVRLFATKLTWIGSSRGWSGAASPVAIRSTTAATDYNAGRWDGVRWMMAIQSPDDPTIARVYQRNQANTLTTTIDTPVHPQGTVRYLALSYDATTLNARVYAVGTTTAVLYYVDYTRVSATWGSWASVSASAILGSGTEWGVRVGGSSGNARQDVIYAVAGSPNTITSVAVATTSTPPAIALFVTSGQAYLNGGPADVGSALPLAWTFSDADPGQTQGSYALSRQIGAGTLAYWNATTSAWVASEVQNSSVTQGLTLASGWGAGTDPTYQYRVKVWDSSGLPAADYGPSLSLVPSVTVNPTVSAPLAAAVLTTNAMTITWTVAEQTAIRVVLATNPGGLIVYDSGKRTWTDTSYTIPYVLATGTGWTLTFSTYNLEGLPSTAVVRNVTVAYPPPPALQSTLTPVVASGWITVTPNALAAVGTQPVTTMADLYRRTRTALNVLANGDFAGSITGYAATGATATYSTTQAHSSPGSARLVPTGAAQARIATTFAASVAAADAVNGLYTASAWIRLDTINKPIQIGVVYYDAGGAELGTTLSVYGSVAALAWQYVEATGSGAAYPTAARIGIVVALTNTPAAGDACYIDDVVLRSANTDAGIRLVAGGDPTAAYNDWGAAAATDHEYRWINTGTNGTTNSGPWLG
jgi:hypothetical protein